MNRRKSTLDVETGHSRACQAAPPRPCADPGQLDPGYRDPVAQKAKLLSSELNVELFLAENSKDLPHVLEMLL